MQHVTCGLQGDWLHVCKAVPLVQTLFKFKAILLVQTERAFYWVHIDWLAPGHPMGAGNPTISRETETQVLAPCQPWPPASPSPGSPT